LPQSIEHAPFPQGTTSLRKERGLRYSGKEPRKGKKRHGPAHLKLFWGEGTQTCSRGGKAFFPSPQKTLEGGKYGSGREGKKVVSLPSRGKPQASLQRRVT